MTFLKEKKIWDALSLGPLSVRKRFWAQNIALHMRSGCLSSSNPSASYVGPVVAFCPLGCSGTGDSWPCLLSPMACIVQCRPSTQPQALAAPASSSFQFPKWITPSPAWIIFLLMTQLGTLTGALHHPHLNGMSTKHHLPNATQLLRMWKVNSWKYTKWNKVEPFLSLLARPRV